MLTIYEPKSPSCQSLVDALHLPRVEGTQLGVLALGAQGDSEAVAAAGVDAHGEALAAVDEDFDDAAIDEDAQVKRFARWDENGRGFGWARLGFGEQGGARVVEGYDAELLLRGHETAGDLAVF